MPNSAACYSHVILCAGGFSPALYPFGNLRSNSGIPVNGKRVIGWILDDLLAKGIQEATIVAREDDQPLQEFLSAFYAGRSIDLEIRLAESDGTILQSLQLGIQDACRCSRGVRVMLGDTLIQDPFPNAGDSLACAEVRDYSRWCHALATDGYIRRFIDKPTRKPPHGALAIAGRYILDDSQLLARSIEKAIAGFGKELSDALTLYSESRPLQLAKIQDWIDFGHIDGLVNGRHRLKFPRHFNSIAIDSVRGVLTKTSTDRGKLRDEADWYASLPDNLKVLTPRFIQCIESKDEVRLEQEYYGYPTVAELYVFGAIDPGTWTSVLEHLFRVHALFSSHKANPAKQSFRAIYHEKTKARLEQIRLSPKGLESVIDANEIEINGCRLLNLPSLQEDLEAILDDLSLETDCTVIHGDYCFSNLLLDLNNMIVRLIDPRGSFHEKGAYGDPRYDIAKLAHSVSGLYDFIVGDHFDLTQRGCTFDLSIKQPDHHREIDHVFWKLCQNYGYRETEIRSIEAILFLSMIPLHSDHPERQLAMYLTAIRKLNEVLNRT